MFENGKRKENILD